MLCQSCVFSTYNYFSVWMQIFLFAFKFSVQTDCGLQFQMMWAILVFNIAEIANSLDLDEVAHNEPPHLDLHCLPSSL